MDAKTCIWPSLIRYVNFKVMFFPCATFGTIISFLPIMPYTIMSKQEACDTCKISKMFLRLKTV